MNKQSGLALTVVIFIIALVIIAGSAYAIFSGPSEELDVEAVSSDLQNELALNFGAKGTVTLDQYTERHIRGSLVGNDGKSRNFLAINAQDKWNVVEYDNNEYSCERAFKLNFPGDFVSDCKLENPEVVTVAQLLKDKKKSGSVSVLGKVKVDPDCNCLHVTSGDETIDIPIPDDDDVNSIINSLDDDDTVIITGTIEPPVTPSDPNDNSDSANETNNSDPDDDSSTDTDDENSNSDSNSNSNSNNSNSSNDSDSDNSDTSDDDSDDPVITIEDIEEVAPEDDDLVDPPSDDDSDDSDDDSGTDSDDDAGDSDDTPSEPQGIPDLGGDTSDEDNPYADLYDIDTSGIPVKLEI